MDSLGAMEFYKKYLTPPVSRVITENTASVLPVDVWFRVLCKIVDELDIDGICSVSIIARELCVFGFVSRDLNTAMWRALDLLGQRCPQLREKDKWFMLFKTPWCFKNEWLADFEDVLNIQLPISIEWLHQKETAYILRDLKVFKLPRAPYNVLIWVGIERNCNFLQAPGRFETVFDYKVDQMKIERMVLQYYFITLKKNCFPKKHFETLGYFRRDLKQKYGGLRQMENKFKMKFMKKADLRLSCLIYISTHQQLFEKLSGARYETWFHENPYTVL